MENINKKAILYGYLSYFIPGMILAFLGVQIGLVNFVFLAFGGYITAKLTPGYELKNTVGLGCTAFAFSLLLAMLIFVSSGDKYSFSSLLYDIFFALLVCFSATVLGGLIRLFQLKKLRNKS